MTRSWTKLALAVGTAIGARQAVKAIRDLEFDDLLDTVGLARRRSTASRVLPILGLIALGGAAGAATALFLAPSSGAQLRTRVANRLGEAKERITEKLQEFESTRADNGARA